VRNTELKRLLSLEQISCIRGGIDRQQRYRASSTMSVEIAVSTMRILTYCEGGPHLAGLQAAAAAAAAVAYLQRKHALTARQGRRRSFVRQGGALFNRKKRFADLTRQAVYVFNCIHC